MSRTFRKYRPKMKTREDKTPVDYRGRVRDGTPQHVSPGCDNNGGCPYCESNRFHSETKRKMKFDIGNFET